MLTCQKHLFSIPDEVSYLNCAYMSPMPKPVELAGSQAVSRKAMPYQIFPKDFFEPVEKLKSLFAELVNVDDPQRIAVVPSVSYGMASVAKNIRMRAGQNIVVVEEIFPSNYFSWKRLVEEAGGELKVVMRPERINGSCGRAWNERILEAIDENTVAVALPHVHWADGTKFDLVAIRKRSHEVGALLIIDGTQSVGALPFDVAAIAPDALVCAGYKWLLGAYGLGLAYYGERFDDGVPLEENWINRLESENFEKLTQFQPAYKAGANRYCMGENSQFIAVPMLTTALELLHGWGVGNIQEYAMALSQPYLDELSNLGFDVEDEAFRSSHLVGIRLPKHVNMDTMKKASLERNVFVSYRAGAMRISTHLFNDAKDFERLMEAVKSIV